MSEEEYELLPLDERLQHKLWKARVHGYNELIKIVENNPSDDTIKSIIKNSEKLKKMVTDSNVVAQETGVKFLNLLLKNLGTDTCMSTRDVVVPGIVEKCLTSSRQGTKSEAIESLLLYVELDTPDGVIELMIPSLSAKLPKLVSAAIKAINEIYLQFGCPIVDPKLILSQIPKLFGHADKNVRTEASNLSVTIRSYLGENFDMIIFPNLKPIQQKDLSKLFNKIEPGIKPTRILKKYAISIKDDDNDIEMTDHEILINDEPKNTVFDPYEFVDSVDVLSKLPSDISERLNDTNWKERVEVLNEITPIFKVVKIEQDDYTYFINLMVGCLRDVNLQVLTLATNIIIDLANGLKKNFEKYVNSLISPLLERTKEKKRPVVDVLNNALDVCFKYSSFHEIVNPSVDGMSHVSPLVKIESMKFLTRCLNEIEKTPSKAQVEEIMIPSIKHLQDPQLPVRNASADLIGTLMKIIGPENSKEYLDKVDKRHLKKIQQIIEKATVKVGNKKQTKVIVGTTSLKNSEIPDLQKNNKIEELSEELASNFSNKTTNVKVIPSKRMATSPLKEHGINHKNNLTSKSLKASDMGSYGLSAHQLQELESLKAEKVEWMETKKHLLADLEDVKSNNSGLLKDIVTLNGKLDDYHNKITTMNMTLKSKDTQIFRYRSDIENYQNRNAQLEQKVKVLQNQIQLLKISGNEESNDINRRISILSIEGEESDAKPMLNFSKAVTTTATGTSSNAVAGNSSIFESNHAGMGNATTVDTSIYNFDDSDDGWKRATAVTNDLKAKIQQMKDRCRPLGGSDDLL